MKRFTKILFSFSIILIFNITISNQKVNADDNTSNNDIEHIYQQGKDEGILNDENMPYDNFVKLMNDSIIPSYNNYKQNDDSINLNDYVKNDHYEVPYMNKDDHPTTVNAEGSPSFHMGDDNIHASDGYSMKAGDILIRYGDNPVWGKSTYVGHAAIATSSKSVLHMPGSGSKAEQWPKSKFFKENSGNGKYIMVYRMKNHPKYAKDAAKYAYNNMYIHNNPSYYISTNLYHEDPSYCSKYVYLSYWWGATPKALTKHEVNAHIVTPHGLTWNFIDSYSPTCIHKVIGE